MKKKTSRLLSILLCCVMLISLLPTAALADRRYKVASTALARLGYPLLTARQLAAAARRDADTRSGWR